MKKKKPNQLVNVLVNILIPTVILVRFSSEAYLGPAWGIVVALAFPIAYGIWDYKKNSESNLFSIIGIISIFLTGGIGLLQIPTEWLAIKEAGVPLILGTLILVFRTKYPFIEKLLHEAIDYERVHTILEEKQKIPAFNARIRKGTYGIAGSFLLSSVLNYFLAITIVTAEPGSELYTSQLGKLTGLSYPIIAFPSMIIMGIALFYVLRGITLYTDLTLEELLTPPSSQ